MSIKSFSEKEFIRYSRHLVLPEFGINAQTRLKSSKVVIVGAGGLGCPVILYLSAAGIGRLTIIDDDKVSLSNLQRQVLFTEEDINKSKSHCAAERLKKINPEIIVVSINQRLTALNAFNLLSGNDLVIDCTDNFSTRYLINDACVLLNIPFVYGSVFRFEGQVSVFNFNNGPNYRDLYPTPPKPDTVPNCEQSGVLGALTGIIGSFQSLEALKILGSFGEPLSGKLLIYDSWSSNQTIVKIPDQNSREKIKFLIDYDEFCGVNKPTIETLMKEVTVQELKAMIDSGSDFQLIDVREPHEYDICNLGGDLIPQGEIPHQVGRILKDKKVILQCRSGARSGNMVNWLEKHHGYTNLYNLKGGILAWAREIDPSMPTY